MNKLKNIICIVLIIIFTISIVPKSFQNDTFFTIAIGEKFLNNEDVNSLVWHDDINFFHSGFFDIIITTIYRLFDFTGIYMFVILIATIQMLLYYFIINKITKKKLFSLIVTLITTYFISNEFTARAQILSFTIFLLEFYCIENIVNNFRKRYIVILILLPVILANLHSSVFPVYFAMYLPYIAEFILSKFNLKNKESQIVIQRNNKKILLILFIISFALGLCNATTISVYTDMFKAMGGLSVEFITELQPLDIFDEIYFSSLLIIVIALLSFTKTKIRLTDSLYILGFGIMALSTYRCVFFFYLISSICIYRFVNDFINLYEINIRDKHVQNILETVITILVVIFSVKKFTYNLTYEYADITTYPVEIADYIVNNLDIDSMRIYNDFHMGSYLEFKGIKVFIDSRSRNVYSRV